MESKKTLTSIDINSKELKKLLSGIPMKELINDWDSFSNEENNRIFLNLDLEKKVGLINSLSNLEREKILEVLSEQNLKLLVAEMEPDDLTDFIQSVSSEIRKDVWNHLSDKAKKETIFLLRFDEDDAAGLMTPRYLAVRSAITVLQAMAFIRKNLKDVETIYYIYVVDELKRLQGVISLKDILSADDHDIIKDIMEINVISVKDETDQEVVAKTLETYDLVSLPVVNQRNQLLGIVTFDDVIDVIREEHTEDTYKMGAMSGRADRYMDTSIIRLVKKRVPWLIILLLVGTITTNVLHHYESIYLGAAFLLLFLPVITQTGGNSGSQSATLMIRGLARDEIHSRDILFVMLKEIFVGIIMGIITGAVIFARSFFLPPGVDFLQAFTIALSLSLVVLFSTLIGALAPLIINKLGFDPTVMSGPLMATVIDVVGLTIYFKTAKLILGL